MDKTNSGVNSTKARTRLVLAGLLFVSIFVFGALIWAGWQTTRLNYAYDQASMAKVREQAVLTARLSKTPATVDAKSGEIYFAQEKLMLPASEFERRLNVGYLPSTTGNANEWDLSVSSDFAFTVGANKLYTAENNDELYKAISELDACQRGVRVVGAKTPSLDNEAILEFKGAIKVSDTRTVYLYAEKGCSNLDDVVTSLKELRAY